MRNSRAVVMTQMYCLKFKYDILSKRREYGAGRKGYSLTPIVLLIFIVDFPSLRWTSRRWVVNTTMTWKLRSSKRTVTEASQQVKGSESQSMTSVRRCNQHNRVNM